MLLSQFLRDDPLLVACYDDPARSIGEGDVGPHVARLQFAALSLAGGWISGVEVASRSYGPTTAKAVFGYNMSRRILRPLHGTSPQDTVTRETLSALDAEIVIFESAGLEFGQ